MAHILVVDDEPSVRALMTLTLKLAGHIVEEASGGEEALGMIERTEFDLIVLDIMMPVTDGYEVLQRLRAMSARAQTPVIVATAKGFEPEGLLREASTGVVDHLSKPFEPEELELAVRRVLDTSKDDLERRRRMHSRGAEVFAAISELRAMGEDLDSPTRRRR